MKLSLLILVSATYASQKCCTEVSKTVGGKFCQRWDRNYPHNIKYRPKNSSHNHCSAADPRDPKPFCYTTSRHVRWQYCDCDPSPNCGLTSPTEQCGVQSVPFKRNRKVQPFSKFTAYGSCSGPGCGVCPAANAYRRRGRSAPSYTPITDFHITVGGVNAERGNLPWQVNLGGQGIMCGGTIVAMNKVVTAAHCVSGNEQRQWTVTAGHNTNNEVNRGGPGVQTRIVRKIVTHPKYDPSQVHHDISIMLLAKPFEYTDYVRPACLPPRNFNLGSSTGRMIISGLGNTAQTGQTDKFPDTMQYTTIPMCSQSTCKSNANIGPYFKEDIMMCGGEAGVDTCQGDSGGPLIANINEKYTLVGVTSFGLGCAQSNSPGVYVRVSSFIDFINNT